MAESETQLAQATAAHDDDVKQLERQRALSKDGITTAAALTTAEATAAVSAARVKAADAAIVSARARVHVIEESLENTNVRAPFDGVVIKKRAEVGETVSPFGVAGQASREGGAIATIADMRELEVQTEVAETSVGKLTRGLPAAVKLQAYPDAEFQGRVREIFPSADRAKAIVEVRVTILNPTADVKPELTASVTFQQPPAARSAASAADANAPVAPTIVVSKRAVAERGGQKVVFVVTNGLAVMRPVVLGPERLDQVEVKNGLAPGEAVILNAPEAVAERRTRADQGSIAMLIELKDVRKQYRRDAIEIPVLDGVSMSVSEGDFLALMGPSGSGKSTLLNLLAGIDQPTSGSITIGGTTISGLSERALAAWRARHVGFIFQLYNLIPVLTAFENVELPLLLTRLSKKQRRDHVMTALDIVSLGDRAGHYPRQLSGGQEQRVAIARAVVTDPTLLLADEPTGDLDAKSGDEILTLLQRLNKEFKKTIIMVTHDPHAADRASHVYHLEKGTFVAA